MTNAIRNLLDTSDDLSSAVADLLEATTVANATWDVLGDPSCFLGMDDDEMIAAWERDLHMAWLEEQWAAGYFDTTQQQIGKLNTQWASFLSSI